MTSCTVKTRAILLDAARHLFANNGITNTTMNDIALESGKGRRTLYKYFKSKEDVFFAIVEEELVYLYNVLNDITKQALSADKKLEKFIIFRFYIIRKIVRRNGNLNAELFRNIWKVETIRRSFDRKEILLIIKILEQGVEQGIFEVPDIKIMGKVIHYTLKGYEVPYIKGVHATTFKELMERQDNVMSLLFNGIIKRD